MLIYYLMQKQKKNLTFLNKSDENVELIDNQIKELKKHMVIPEQISKIIDNTQNEYLKAKLKDIRNNI